MKRHWMRSMKTIVGLLVLPGMVLGCAGREMTTTEKTALGGTLIGAGTGAIVGGAAKGGKGAATGTAIGAGLGALTGALAGQAIEAEAAKARTPTYGEAPQAQQFPGREAELQRQLALERERTRQLESQLAQSQQALNPSEELEIVNREIAQLQRDLSAAKQAGDWLLQQSIERQLEQKVARRLTLERQIKSGS